MIDVQELISTISDLIISDIKTNLKDQDTTIQVVCLIALTLRRIRQQILLYQIFL
jgi:hypothetical protein